MAEQDEGLTWSLPPLGAFTVIDHVWVKMEDGVSLSARLWIPSGQPTKLAPAVLEYIPYRKDDAYRRHDDAWGAALAGHGIAYARVDVRGTGNSQGVMTDEYSQAELDDGCAVIAWLAEQSWSNGRVGMRGLSWGGINTLQIAALRPPALKAIMPMGCLANRYSDDAHYIGGALGQTNLQWGVGFKLAMAGPPDPQVVGPDWEPQWRARLEASPAIIGDWMRHQSADRYWQRGSIDQDWSAIEVPTYIVAGWQDTYANPVGRLMANLTCPRKALIGPWGHTYPSMAAPISLDWVFEEVRWWEHWLKGADTGIMDEPAFRAFMPYAPLASPEGARGVGRWIAEGQWPYRSDDKTFFLSDRRLDPSPQPSKVAELPVATLVGLTRPQWLDRPPTEQSWDDARSLQFESSVLTEDIELLGYPQLDLSLTSDQTVAMLAVRLNEVDEQGQSWPVTWAVRNLARRMPTSAAEPLDPGQAFTASIPMAMIAHRFRKGSRIRLCLSAGLWPMVWPAPRTARLTLKLGEQAVLTLPTRPVEAVLAPFPIPVRHHEAASAQPGAKTTHQPNQEGWFTNQIDAPPSPFTITATDMIIARGRWETSQVRQEDPNSGCWRHRATSSWERGDWGCEIEAACTLTSTPQHFVLSESLIARQGETVVFEKHDTHQIPRDLM